MVEISRKTNIRSEEGALGEIACPYRYCQDLQTPSEGYSQPHEIDQPQDARSASYMQAWVLKDTNAGMLMQSASCSSWCWNILTPNAYAASHMLVSC